jgi:hypothetical protein
MNTKMLKLARHHFDRPDIPRSVVRHNCRAWARSIRLLGDKWILVTKVEKKNV